MEGSPDVEAGVALLWRVGLSKERIAAVSARMTAARQVLSRQGAVVASWRVERGLRMGPYFRLAFRQIGLPRFLGRKRG